MLALAPILALTIAPAPAPVLAQPADYCPDNLLLNPSFESGFTSRGRVVETVGNGWNAWYETLPGVDGVNYVPDYAPARRDVGPVLLTADGLWSQQQATSGATHTAGLWQTVTVPPASLVRASALAYAWASNAADTARSRPYGTYVSQLGLDPLGGRDPNAPGVRWTEPVTDTDAWVPLVLELPVEGPAVTLFTRGQPLVKLVQNVSRWDAACLRVLGPAEGPTLTPTPTVSPTRPGPSVTPEPTPDEAVARVIIARQLLARGSGLEPAEATPGARATLDALSTRIAGGPGAGSPLSDAGQLPAAGVPLGAPPELEAGAGTDTASTTPEDELLGWLDENLGLMVLALAAFVGGLVLAAGRAGGPAA